MKYYYPKIGTLHHYKEDLDIARDFREKHDIEEKLFESHFLEEFLKKTGVFPMDYLHNKSVYQEIKEEERDRERVKMLFAKNYPETYKENIKIIRRFLLLLRKHHIKPYIVIPPFPSTFRLYMEKEMYQETLHVLYDFKEEFSELEILDFMYDSRFDSDYYFADVDHLNYFGASLLADCMNEYFG